MLKLSAHCCIKNALSQNYPYIESIISFANFCNEVIVVDGGSTDGSIEEIKRKCPDSVKVVHYEWPDVWVWHQLALSNNYGLSQCSGDVAIKFDVDYVFNDTTQFDFLNEIEIWMDKGGHPIPPIAFTCRKFNFLLADKFFQKAISPLAINIRDYDLKYGQAMSEDRDYMFAIFPEFSVKDNKDREIFVGRTILDAENLIQGTSGELYVYDFTFMDKKTSEGICQRADRAKVLGDRSVNKKRVESRIKHVEDRALKKMRRMMLARYGKYDCTNLKLSKHPVVMKEKLETMTKDMFGYKMFDWVEEAEQNPDPDWYCKYVK